MADAKKSDTPNQSRMAKLWPWLRFVALSAVVSLVILYMLFAAEFTAIRAVYEAY